MAVQATTTSPSRRNAAVRIDRRALRLRRQITGLNLAQLAEAAAISPGYAAHIERGTRETVSPAVFVRICDALAVSDRTELMVKDTPTGGDQ